MITGWIEKSLGELFDFSGGFSASRADLSTKGYPYLHYGDIHGSKRTFIDVCVDGSIPQLDIDLNKVSKASLLNNGDIVFVDASEDDEGASRHIVVRNEKNMPFISGLHTIVAKSKNDELDNRFREFCFQSVTVKSQFKFYAVGTKVTGISKSVIGKITLYYPKDKAEQRRIAEVLSDTDALIAAMEKLIAKKRAVKQGAMQELLTGKRRLPGFEGEFVNMNLIANSTLKARIGWQGLTTAEYLDTGYSYLITGTDFFNGRIMWDTCHYVNKYRYDQDVNIQVMNGDILITKDGTIGKVAIVNGMNKKATLNSGVFVLRPKAEAYECRFVYYVLLSQVFIDFLDKLAAGSTINHLYQKDFINFEFSIPPTKSEQTVIAEIFSDMDAEIDALTAKLNKLRNIKQGMMSELLTGRIRLPEQKAMQKEEAKAVVNAKGFTFQTAEEFIEIQEQENENAVIIAIITYLYASGKFPLNPFYIHKFSYLLQRHIYGFAKGYCKMAAGPYNPALNDALVVAANNNYIVAHDAVLNGHEYDKWTVGKDITEAKKKFIQKYGNELLRWLKQFKSVKPRHDELELLTTVDFAMVELRQNGKPVTVPAIKEIMRNDKNWKEKLTRELFSDKNITRAIDWSNELFGQGN